MFQITDFLMIGKIDVKPVFDFDEDACRQYVRDLNPEIEVVPVSAKTGEGFDKWIDWLTNEIEKFRAEGQ